MDKLIGPKELDIIKDNMGAPLREIKDIIARATGCQVTEQAIHHHLSKIRDTNSLQSDVISTSIDTKVQQFIEINTNEYLAMLNENIHQINDILHDRCQDVTLRDSGDKINPTLFNNYSNLLAKQIKLAFDIRPPEETIKRSININVDIPTEQLIDKYFNEYSKKEYSEKDEPKDKTSKIIDITPNE